MSINQFAEDTLNWAGAGAVAFEREAMLAGDPATMVYFDVGAVTLDFGSMLPADLDGSATVEIVVSIEEGAANPLVNTAEVSSTTPDPDPDDNTVTIETNVVFHNYFPLVLKNYQSP
jgi:hypothetical protein